MTTVRVLIAFTPPDLPGLQPALFYQLYECVDDPPPALDNYLMGDTLPTSFVAASLLGIEPSYVCLEEPAVRDAWDAWVAANP